MAPCGSDLLAKVKELGGWLQSDSGAKLPVTVSTKKDAVSG